MRRKWECLTILTPGVRAIFALLAYELFGKPLTIDAAAVDWQQVLALGRKHAVTPLLYPGMKRLGAAVPAEVAETAHQTAMLSLMNGEKLLWAQDKIIGILAENNIPCAVLKGMSVACCYPNSELRAPGDIDLLVGEANYDAATEVLKSAGMVLDHETIMHRSFEGFGVEVEVHRSASVFPETEKGAYVKGYMSDAQEHTQTGFVSEHHFPMLACPYQFISLLAHIERHMGHGGIGPRQVCDWAVTVHANREKFDAQTLELLDRCGLLHFAKIITRICEKYLGLPENDWCKDAQDELVDAVMGEILDAGNFHEHQGKHSVGSMLMDSYDEGENGERSAIGNYIRNTNRRVRRDYKWAKGPLWLPLFWAYFPIQYLFRVLTGKRKKISLTKTIRAAREKDQLMHELKLYK